MHARSVSHSSHLLPYLRDCSLCMHMLSSRVISFALASEPSGSGISSFGALLFGVVLLPLPSFDPDEDERKGMKRSLDSVWFTLWASFLA